MPGVDAPFWLHRNQTEGIPEFSKNEGRLLNSPASKAIQNNRRRTMHAVVFPAPETVSVERVPDPAPRRDEVVVQVATSSAQSVLVQVLPAPPGLP